MNKKQLVALADAIREHNNNGLSSEYPFQSFNEGQIEALANFCQSQNPNFKRERWLGYIAGENGKNGGSIK
jgi:hypothetical protein